MTSGASLTGPPSAAPPSRAVLAAYGVQGPATLLRGGQGTSWRADDLVLKPDRPDFAEWLASVLAGPFDGVRVAPPVRTSDGAWGVDGWTAAPLLAGAPDVRGRHAEVFTGARALQAGLPDVAEPPWSQQRPDPWARADRIAWGEERTRPPGPVATVLEDLLGPVRQVDLPVRLTHLDLAGNVLLDDALPPAVIDLSPYWRPAAYARAVVVVDLMLWHDASADVTALADLGEHSEGLLRRALAFRLGAHALLAPDAPPAELGPYAAAAHALLGR